MPCGNFYYATCHNPEPSFNNHNKQWRSMFRRKIMSKNLHSDIMGASIMELHSSLK